MKKEDYDQLTAEILNQMESVSPEDWAMPWHRLNILPLRSNGIPYKGVNALLLSMKRYIYPNFLTFKQAHTLGGSVKKGEKGHKVIYAASFERINKDGEIDKCFMHRYYTVFNAAQIEGLPDQFYPKGESDHDPGEKITDAERFFSSIDFKFKSTFDRACYSPSDDFINLPPFERFDTPLDYYSTLAHELIHWTGSKERLNRITHTKYGSEDYAFEELVAELGAAFVMVRLGLRSSPRLDHAQYLKNWISLLKDHSSAFLKASSLAQTACDHLFKLAGYDQEEIKESEPELIAA